MAEPTVYQYRLRTADNRWLAEVFLRSDGLFTVVSDYGNYGYWWGNPGRPVREFVAALADRDESDYLCGKLGSRDWWDGTSTLKAIREHIIEYRRDGSWTKERAAEEWQTLSEALTTWHDVDARNATEMDELQFHNWFRETKIDDASEFAAYDYEPQLRAFASEVMPVLATAIREQLKAEAAVADATASLAEWEHEGGSL
ncbi:hypothetical protein JKA73_17760 [Myxococcus xanthus]|uniref:hypothetical protein n=1 Tax=Myxococcus xanthus TaxID=34 RepID=UPI0019176483|nr:hypothetical protein [Myxococcus xanthus]QQR47781.1 hypothetical protein JKA73_17760 [Myxococcus xanthus]